MSVPASAIVRTGRRATVPVALVVLALLPLILMPLAAVFVFAFRGGAAAFLAFFRAARQHGQLVHVGE